MASVTTRAATSKYKVAVSYVLGRCVPSLTHNAAKIEVKQNVFNPSLNGHFAEKEYVFAWDPEKTVKSGDIVLIRQLPEKRTKLITHDIVKIVYKLGDIIDPITNKPVTGDQYRDIIEKRNRLYGEVENSFDYKKAPPGGRLEGTQDFTDKPIYTKYYEADDNPYAY